MTEENREEIIIILDRGQEIKCECPKSVFEEVLDELRKAMTTGGLFSINTSYNVEMCDMAGNYISVLNGSKIVGYSF